MESIFKIFYTWLNEYSEPLLKKTFPSWISPNSITYFRILLALPTLCLLFFEFKNWAIAIYIVAGLLDYADGALARGRKIESDWGKFLDPLADKIFFILLALPLSVIVFMCNKPAYSSGILLTITISSIMIETLIMAVRVEDYAYNRAHKNAKRELKANYAGKIKFNLQTFGLGFMILAYPKIDGLAVWLSLGLIAASLPFACLSYGHKNRQ